MIRKIVYAIFAAIIVIALVMFFAAYPFGANKMAVGTYYLNHGVAQTGAANIVTSVVLDYRGFDTLGEVSVLFAAAAGVAILFFMLGIGKKERENLTKPNFVVRVGSRIIFPFILLFGTYIFVHGHLTPGGGFQGGSIIASGFLLLYLSYPGTRVNRGGLSIIEGLAGLTFVVLGLWGLFTPTDSFLYNFLPKGLFNTLVSAGILPIIYIAIGFKVASEFAGIVDDMMCEVICRGGEK